MAPEQRCCGSSAIEHPSVRGSIGSMPGLTRTSSSWPWRTRLLGSPGQCCRAATNTGQQLCQHNGRGKDAFGLEALRSHFPTPRRRTSSPPKSAQGQQGRKNSHNGVSTAWFRQWASTSDRLIRMDTRATHHGQEKRSPHKGRIHLRRLVFSPEAFPLQSRGGPYIFGTDQMSRSIGDLPIAQSIRANRPSRRT